MQTDTSSPLPSRMNRRSLLAAALAGAGTIGGRLHAEESKTPPVGAPLSNPILPHGNPSVYRFHIGEFEAFSFSDCALGFREGLGLMWPEEQREQMKQELIANGAPLDVLPLYVNILLIRRGKDVAVFDAGFGERGNDRMGWLLSGMRSVGIQPEEVTLGFLSHAHSDHLNGFVTQDGRKTFPNARVHTLRAEIDFWRGPNPDFSKSRRDKKPLPDMVREVNRSFDILGDSLVATKDGATFLDGAIRVEAAPGHTAGHACFRIVSQGAELLHLMDVAHHHLLMFVKPEWNIAFDHDADEAIVTRKKYWKESAASHVRCYGFHLPWPGLGRVVASHDNPDQYRWSAEAWDWPAQQG